MSLRVDNRGLSILVYILGAEAKPNGRQQN